jgi:DNA processing protein
LAFKIEGMDSAELTAWLRLVETPLVGRDAARRLLAAFGSAEAAVDASANALLPLIGAEAATALRSPSAALLDLCVFTAEWLAGGTAAAPRHVLSLGDPDYPQSLLQTPDPPLLLHAIGRIDLLRAASLAVVGSRNPSPQGTQNARAFATGLSRCGVTIVSGLALGIDGAAHEGALEGAGRTVAVVGTGLDRVYPRSHRELAHRIAEHGLIVSEYPLGTPPLAHHFPQRNRIIAGLSQGTLVVEAALESGSLITARLASEAGRDVFAIPGSIHSPHAKGCHALIKQGAKLVDSVQDIVDELPGLRAAAPQAVQPSEAGPVPDSLLEALGFDPVGLDELQGRTGLPAARLQARLLELELAGRVARMPGQLFQRIASG